jgi:hypothetical protein
MIIVQVVFRETCLGAMQQRAANSVPRSKGYWDHLLEEAAAVRKGYRARRRLKARVAWWRGEECVREWWRRRRRAWMATLVFRCLKRKRSGNLLGVEGRGLVKRRRIQREGE